jgi:hypothetical protein
MTQNRRRSVREKHDSVLELTDESGRPLADVTRLVDISMHGVCFASTEKLEPGQRVRGTLRLLARGALTVSGRILWRKVKNNVTHYGLAFDAADSPAPAANPSLGGSE